MTKKEVVHHNVQEKKEAVYCNVRKGWLIYEILGKINERDYLWNKIYYRKNDIMVGLEALQRSYLKLKFVMRKAKIIWHL